MKLGLPLHFTVRPLCTQHAQETLAKALDEQQPITYVVQTRGRGSWRMAELLSTSKTPKPPSNVDIKDCRGARPRAATVSVRSLQWPEGEALKS